MHIIIDARETYNTSGKARYVQQLIIALAKEDQQNHYSLLVAQTGLELPNNFEQIVIHGNPFLFARRFMQQVGDIFFSPCSYIMSVISPLPTITTVHDLAIFIEKRARPTVKTKLIERLTLGSALRKSKAIITVSQSTKVDICRLFSVKEDKVTTIPLAPMLNVDAATMNEIQSKYSIPDNYILFVGTIEPRKNITTIIKAHRTLETEIRNKFPLVIVGKQGWNSSNIITEIGNDPLIRLTGMVSDAELAAFYNNAKLFIFPSYYEGFGLPVLEALSYGVPVITARNSSLPEIAGEAADYIDDPENATQIASYITRLLKDENVYQARCQKAVAQAKKFSWSLTAKKTLTIFSSIHNQDNIS